MIKWDLFYTYLTTVRNRKIRWEKKEERRNYDVEFSRFNATYSYFRSKPFNVYTCNEFLSTFHNKSNSTRNNHLKILKSICGAMRYYNMEVDEVISPIERIEYLEKRRVRKIELLSKTEIEKLADLRIPYGRSRVQINRRWRAIIYTLSLGLRIQEVCRLTWDRYNGEVFDLNDTKTPDGDRYIFVPVKLRRLIDKLEHYEHNYIFGSIQGKLNDKTANDELKMRASILGIKKRVHAHMFRHSFIYRALKNGMPLQDVMAHVGHKDPKVTMQYAHIGIDQTKKVVEGDELFRSKTIDKTRERLKNKIDLIQDKKILESMSTMLGFA